ncbi:MAG: phytanoyl-CoA dioxygenase family protein [Opitutales bacterium]
MATESPSLPWTGLSEQDGYFSRENIGPEAGRFFDDNGYLVVTDGADAGELETLLKETVAIARGERGAIGGSPWGETGKAPAALDDDAVQKQVLCIHHPHKISETIYQALALPTIKDVCTTVVGPNVKCMQSMLFIKAAGKPGQAWHQDEDYIPTRDRSLIGAWIAMDPATTENGCLWVIPGSHKPGILWPQYPHKDPRFDCASEAYDFPYSDEDSIPVQVPAGAIVFFNGYLLHRSLPNKAKTGYRRVLVNHYMSAESHLPWFGVGNEMEYKSSVAKADYRDIVMIAGEDPYAWKGIREIARPHIRAAGEGGCGDGREHLADWKAKKDVETRMKA